MNKTKFKITRLDIIILLSILFLSALAILCYFFVDTPLFEITKIAPLKRHLNPWQDAFRQLGKTWLVIWLLLVWGWLSNKPRVLLMGILALLILAPFVGSLKGLHHRTRPKDVIKAPARAATGDYKLRSSSFPSGDTANCFAVAVILSSCIGGLWPIPLFATAAAIGVLRVTALAHYPSDALAGAAIGILCGWIALHLARKWPQIADAKQFTATARDKIGIAIIAILPFVSLIERVNPIFMFLKKFGLLLILLLILYKKNDIRTWLKKMPLNGIIKPPPPTL
ncbi:MAG: phosphatase PAP2 family protein [Planctomycetes bacterium]|nr:phosphatase PAP2 family protein [Planctomycetota bacterium]